MDGGSPWLIERPDEAVIVPSTAASSTTTTPRALRPEVGRLQILIGVPHDMPIVGYGGRTVNVLRLFSARASDQFDIGIFNSGDYIRAVHEKITGESISKVLYPSDIVAARQGAAPAAGVLPRGLLAARHRPALPARRGTFDDFADKVAIQMNDTHPALTVAELMRIFVDEERQPWEEAWDITAATCGYTNHTLLPEALERWSFDLLERVLPRHLQIIQEINRRLLAEVGPAFPATMRLQHMSPRREGDAKCAWPTWPWPAATR